MGKEQFNDDNEKKKNLLQKFFIELLVALAVIVIIFFISPLIIFRYDGLSFDRQEEISEYKDCFYYNALNETEKKIYSCYYHALKNHSRLFGYSFSGSEEEYQHAIDGFDYDWPQFYWMSSDCYSGSLLGTRYIYYTDDVFDKNSESFNNEVLKLTNELKRDNDYDTIKAIYDYIILNTVYDYDSLDLDHKSFEFVKKGTSYSCLIDKLTICEGYSKAFKLLCNSLGYECIIVDSIVEDDHCWNMVKINDKWYEVDTTWADTNTEEEDILTYEYFLVPDNIFELNHNVVKDYSYPKCNDDDLYMRDMAYLYSENANKNQIDTFLINNIKKGKHDFYIRLNSLDDVLEMKDYLFSNDRFVELINAYNIDISGEYTYFYHYDDKSYMLFITIY